jgi:hypothetical protein
MNGIRTTLVCVALDRVQAAAADRTCTPRQGPCLRATAAGLGWGGGGVLQSCSVRAASMFFANIHGPHHPDNLCSAVGHAEVMAVTVSVKILLDTNERATRVRKSPA